MLSINIALKEFRGYLEIHQQVLRILILKKSYCVLNDKIKKYLDLKKILEVKIHPNILISTFQTH